MGDSCQGQSVPKHKTCVDQLALALICCRAPLACSSLEQIIDQVLFSIGQIAVEGRLHAGALPYSVCVWGSIDSR